MPMSRFETGSSVLKAHGSQAPSVRRGLNRVAGMSGSKEEVESYARWHKLRTVEAYRAIHQANDKVLATRQSAGFAFSFTRCLPSE